MTRERLGAAFVVSIYGGQEAERGSWPVDSRLIVDAGLPEVLGWLRQNLPTGCCWSLGVVRVPHEPTPESDLVGPWFIGADVLNTDPADRSPEDQRTAEEMLARRHRVHVHAATED